MIRKFSVHDLLESAKTVSEADTCSNGELSVSKSFHKMLRSKKNLGSFDMRKETDLELLS